MRRGAGKLRANMFIYKMIGETTSKRTFAAILDEEGDVGNYNWANRSLNHFVENSFSTIVAILLNSFVYGVPTLVLVCLYAVGRIMH